MVNKVDILLNSPLGHAQMEESKLQIISMEFVYTLLKSEKGFPSSLGKVNVRCTWESLKHQYHEQARMKVTQLPQKRYFFIKLVDENCGKGKEIGTFHTAIQIRGEGLEPVFSKKDLSTTPSHYNLPQDEDFSILHAFTLDASQRCKSVSISVKWMKKPRQRDCA